jgi:drug/metabolite transporter (DMT)-like permease
MTRAPAIDEVPAAPEIALQADAKGPSTAQVALATTVLSWAGAFVAIRIALERLSGPQLTVARLGVASVAFLVAMLVRRRVPRIPRADWPAMVAAGATGMFGYQLLLNIGEQTVEAGTAAILVNVGPLFTVLFAALLLGEHITRRTVLGGGIALLGAVLVAIGAGGGLSIEAGTLFVLGAALSSTAYFLLLKRLTVRSNPFDVTAVATWVGALLVSPVAVLDPIHVGDLPTSTITSVLFLGIVSSAVGFLAWTVALSTLPAGTTSLTLYVIPAVTVVIAVLLLGEAPNALEVLGGLVALVGVGVLRTHPKAKRAKPAMPVPAPERAPRTPVGS